MQYLAFEHHYRLAANGSLDAKESLVFRDMADWCVAILGGLRGLASCLDMFPDSREPPFALARSIASVLQLSEE